VLLIDHTGEGKHTGWEGKRERGTSDHSRRVGRGRSGLARAGARISPEPIHVTSAFLSVALSGSG